MKHHVYLVPELVYSLLEIGISLDVDPDLYVIPRFDPWLSVHGSHHESRTAKS